MDTIVSYIENLFRSYPDTPQVQKAKRELLGIMEDKYRELKAEGKSEHEAIGIVISEFGSMEEIASELDMDGRQEEGRKYQEESAPVMSVTMEKAYEYLRVQKNFGFKIAVGVALCILSPVAGTITEGLAGAGLMPRTLSEIWTFITLFGMVAVAVGIFIVSGIAHGKYDDYESMPIRLDSRTKERLNGEYEASNKAFGIKVAAGVILCILSVIPAGVLDEMLGGTSLEWLAEMSAVSLFVFVAAGVFLFITSGVERGAYETLLGKGKKARRLASGSKKDKRISIAASIYWPVVTAIYLGWSLATMNWGFTWIVWPVSGVLFGGISAVITLVSED